MLFHLHIVTLLYPIGYEYWIHSFIWAWNRKFHRCVAHFHFHKNLAGGYPVFIYGADDWTDWLTDVEKVIDIFCPFLVKGPKVFFLWVVFLSEKKYVSGWRDQIQCYSGAYLWITELTHLSFRHVWPPAVCLLKLLSPPFYSSNYFNMSTVFVMQFNIGEFF